MRTFPARFLRETLISGWFPARTPLTSGKNPVKGTCRIFPFPRTVKFRPEYCFHLSVLFRPDLAGNTREPAGKRRKKRRFVRNPSGSGDRNHRPGIPKYAVKHVTFAWVSLVVVFSLITFDFLKVHLLLRKVIQLNIMTSLDRINVKKTIKKVLAQWNLLLLLKFSNDPSLNMVFIIQNILVMGIQKHFLFFLKSHLIQVQYISFI